MQKVIAIPLLTKIKKLFKIVPLNFICASIQKLTENNSRREKEEIFCKIQKITKGMIIGLGHSVLSIYLLFLNRSSGQGMLANRNDLTAQNQI